MDSLIDKDRKLQAIEKINQEAKQYIADACERLKAATLPQDVYKELGNTYSP